MNYSYDRKEQTDKMDNAADVDSGMSAQEWCFVCDRPKNDCACVENGGTY